MKKVEHIGIAVKNLEESISRYETLLQANCYKREIVLTEHVETAFFKIGESKIELLAAIDNKGVIASFIEKRGEGIHHIAYEVDDIRAEMARLVKAGFKLLNKEPKKGADNKMICFVHPKDTSGVLIELTQEFK